MDEVLRLLNRRNESGSFNRLIGLQLITAGEGCAELCLPMRPELLNPLGKVHGGVIYTLCDVAAGAATASSGRVGVTLNSSMSYLRPGEPTADLIAKTRLLKLGRTTAVHDVDVYQGERLIASGQFTMFFTGGSLRDYQ